jgi:NAD-dependent DNA ligase
MTRKWLLPTYQQQVDKLEPVIKSMKPERARQLAQLFEEMKEVAKAYSNLSRAIEEFGEVKDETIALYVENLCERDAIILRDFIKEQENEKDKVYYEIPCSKADLFGNLSVTAEDVWNDAPRDEDGELIEPEIAGRE